MGNPLQTFYRQIEELVEHSDQRFLEQGPSLLEKAAQDTRFLRAVEEARGDQMRAVVMGEVGKPVIVAWNWPLDFSLRPHEHHGKSCFDIGTQGQFVVVNYMPHEEEKGVFTLEEWGTQVVNPGQIARVDPRVTEVHSVYCPLGATSIHVYPAGSLTTTIFEKQGEKYLRKEIQVPR